MSKPERPPQKRPGTQCSCIDAQSLWLPFTDKLDWDSIALIVHKDNTSEIPDLIARTDITVSRLLPWLAAMQMTVLDNRCLGAAFAGHLCFVCLGIMSNRLPALPGIGLLSGWHASAAMTPT